MTVKTKKAIRSLNHMNDPVISLTSSRKRLIASPGDCGKARAPGHSRMRASRFLRSRPPTSNMNGRFVSPRLKEEKKRPIEVTINRTSSVPNPKLTGAAPVRRLKY